MHAVHKSAVHSLSGVLSILANKTDTICGQVAQIIVSILAYKDDPSVVTLPLACYISKQLDLIRLYG